MQTNIEGLDEDRIRDAVQRAEERTSAEIVPVVMPQSADYEIATWRGSAVAALFALVGMLLLLEMDGGPSWLRTPLGVVLMTLGAGSVGALLGTYVPAVQRGLVGSDRLDETVRRRAQQFFVEEEVFSTRDRTGILIYVSLHERRVEVLGDTGVNDQIRPDDWEEVVRHIREGLQDDELMDGLVGGINMCGRLLERRGVNARPEAENQLEDAVRTPAPSDSEEAGGQEARSA